MSRLKMFTLLLHLTLILLITTAVNSRIIKARHVSEDCRLSQRIKENIASYSNATNAIIDLFLTGAFKGKTWTNLEDFIDTFGNRMAGSTNLENAIDYMVKASAENNLENIHTEEVKIPKWVRGAEYVTLLEPYHKNIPMLGLGLSVGTPPEGITADAVVVQSFDELKALPDVDVAGKIVIYNEPYVNYGETVIYRSKGASEAAKKGAIAALVRSITPFSLSTPHTGMQSYEANVTKIPIAAITHEDADLFGRLHLKKKRISIKMLMSATLGTAMSRNTIVELKGSTLPDRVVIVSGHIDSWDVGDGAMDDGGGAFISWMAPIALKHLQMRPRRTLRAILWTAEEVGLVGAEAYEERHRNESGNLAFVMESDDGTFRPTGIAYTGSKSGECVVKEILKLFVRLNSTGISFGESGPDIGFWTGKGIPGGGLMNANEKYFWYHHSDADRLSVLDSDTLDQAAAFWTAFAYVIADMPIEIPRK